MSPAWVRVRKHPPSKRHPKGHTTFAVLYRRGGRSFRTETAGTFATQRDAKLRRDLVSGWIAAGKNPADELAKLTGSAPRRRTFREWANAYRDSRVDLVAGSDKNIGSHLLRILTPALADRDPHTFTVADVQEWVTANSDLAPSSLVRYMVTFRLILDFATVDPNPARDRRVRLPRVEREEPTPPTARELLAVLDRIPRKWRLPIVLLEQTGMRVGELAALEWGDVDLAENRFRLRAAASKTRRPRWVQVPEWLMAVVADTCPLEDRAASRRLVRDLTESALWTAIDRACTLAGVPRFSPHDLRHRRISLWHGQGIPAKQLAERAGHSKASMSLDIYSHVMPLDEAGRDELEARL